MANVAESSTQIELPNINKYAKEVIKINKLAGAKTKIILELPNSYSITNSSKAVKAKESITSKMWKYQCRSKLMIGCHVQSAIGSLQVIGCRSI